MRKWLVFMLAMILLLGLTAGCGSAELTAQEAGAIIEDVNDRYGKIFHYLFSPTSAMQVDRSRTLSGDPDMRPVTDERFPDLQAVRDFLGTVVTDAFIDKQFPIIFNEDYISPQEVELRGFNADDCATVYYEYEGRLYANQDPPMASVDFRQTDWNAPKIVTQSATKIAVKYPLVFPHYLSSDTIYYEPDGSITYTVIKENDTWLLDDITKKEKDSAVPHGDVSAADLTDEQVADILAVLVQRQQQIEFLFHGDSGDGVDESAPCPIDSNYCLSTDVRFSCVQDIKDYISGVVTADEAQGYFDRYLGEVQDSSSGMPEYIDYDGKLYRNVASGGRGYSTTYLIKSSRIVERTKDTVKIEMDTLHFGEPDSWVYTPTLVKTADGWRVDNDMHKGYESE